MKKVLLIFLLTPISAFADLTCDTNVTDYFVVYETNQYTCNSGYYLPANVDGCQVCPYGYTCVGGTYNFNTTTDQGINGNSYTCNSGYYLPANALACVACPTGFTCPGGTFDFNPNTFQGLNFNAIPTTQMNNVCATNFPNDLFVIYEPNSHTCSSGYYLPMGVDACATCPTGGNCSGGTFTFNKTTNQGVDSCDSGYHKDNGTCVANTITVRWDDGNGGAYSTTCTYGGALTTPTTEPVAPRGYHFTGWTFNLGN